MFTFLMLVAAYLWLVCVFFVAITVYEIMVDSLGDDMDEKLKAFTCVAAFWPVTIPVVVFFFVYDKMPNIGAIIRASFKAYYTAITETLKG